MGQFYFGMKVSLNDEIGIVIRIEENSHWDKEPGVIRWDTNKKFDTEDWRGMFGSFKDSGGKEIDSNIALKYINEKGELIK